MNIFEQLKEKTPKMLNNLHYILKNNEENHEEKKKKKKRIKIMKLKRKRMMKKNKKKNPCQNINPNLSINDMKITLTVSHITTKKYKEK